MANDAVMETVRAEMEKNPDVPTQELYTRTAKKHPQVKELDLRQFNARYPLQVRRRQAQGTKPKKKSARKASRKRSVSASKSGKAERQGSSRAERDRARETIRTELLNFARKIASAEDRGELVATIADVDRHVDRVMASERKG